MSRNPESRNPDPRTLMLLKSTTRHIRIFAATIQNDELVPCTDTLTLDIDPDNELLWNDSAIQQVYRKFDALIEAYDGADLTDYNLRRIGSDLEHFLQPQQPRSKLQPRLTPCRR
jgi:NAD(P)H-quinone oxidoreductase subunit M